MFLCKTLKAISKYLFSLAIACILYACSTPASRKNEENIQIKTPEILEKFIGKWEYIVGTDTGIETWNKVNDSIYLGFSTNRLQTDTFERITLSREKKEWYYSPRFGHDLLKGTDFKLLEYNSNTILFVNRENDFPDSIRYTFSKNDSLTALLYGNNKGVYSIETIPMKRIR